MRDYLMYVNRSSTVSWTTENALEVCLFFFFFFESNLQFTFSYLYHFRVIQIQRKRWV